MTLSSARFMLLLAAAAAIATANFAMARIEELPPPLEKQMKPEDLKEIKAGTGATNDSNCHPEDVDLYFLVDKSGSVGSRNFQTVRQFLENIVSKMQTTGPLRSRVGVIEFDASQYLKFDLKQYDNVPAMIINSVINRIPYSWGGTNIGDAMNFATDVGFTAEHGDRPDSSNIMVVITDGQDDSDVRAAYARAAAKGVKVIAIGIGSDVKREELTDMVGGNVNFVFDVSGFDHLDSIINTVCDELSPCDGDPCLNGGTCVEQNHNFTCQCVPGFQGPLCQMSADACDSDPCENGGTCLPVGGDFSCTCPVGFTGKDCHNQICPHGRFWCECDFGYTGPACDHVIDFCNQTNIRHDGSIEHLDICGPYGTCHSNQNGAYCTCDQGWTGPQCDHDINDCSPNPCENGATCENLLGPGYKCYCPELYTGTNCERVPNFCDDLEILGTDGTVTNVPICGEHGRCNSTAMGAKCICDPAYTGQFCQTEIPFNCTYTNHHGISHTYPHNATWIDECNECICEYGNVTCAKSFWCPHKCAIYETNRTRVENLPTHCPPHQNCIPETVECAAPKPKCDYPVGWCFPVGHIMVDTLTIPTNPPQGWQHL